MGNSYGCEEITRDIRIRKGSEGKPKHCSLNHVDDEVHLAEFTLSEEAFELSEVPVIILYEVNY